MARDLTADHVASRHTPRASRSVLRRHPVWTAILATLAILVALAYVAAFLMDEPLRRTLEQRLNQNLKGYTARVGAADLHPIGLALDLEEVVIAQQAHPEPPVVRLPRLGVSVQWEALLTFNLVADVIFERPAIDLNLTQIESEATDDESLADRGWQDALQSIYPLEINELRIVDGSVNYKDAGDLPPIQITDLDALAENIRNIRSADRTYPSRLHASARLLDAADLRFDGHADFLAKPHAGVEGDVVLKGLPLEPLQSIARHSQLYVSGGTLSAEGEVEYAPKIQRVVLEEARIENVKVDLLTGERSTAPAERIATNVAEQVAKPEERPEVQIAAKRIEIVDSDIGFVNHNADPQYRLFVSDLDATITDYSNARGHGGGSAEMSGLFLGSGPSKVKARFQPAAEQTDFSLDLSIQDTDMRRMNDLFRAHGGFDVKSGTFSFFTELSVSRGRIEGYVKPLFSDLDVYDLEQDADENPLQQLYEGVIGGVSILFENRPRDEVATRSDISGSIENPETSTLDLLIGLIQNAFFKAILPGLEQNVRPGRSEE